MVGARVKKIIQLIETVPICGLFFLFRIFPLAWASWAGGFLARLIGPLLPVTKRALLNVQTIFPHKTANEHKSIIRNMWWNLGRTAGELPHLSTLIQRKDHLVIEDPHNAASLFKTQPVLVFSAHLANWELAAPCVSAHLARPMSLIYRKINNPYVERLITSFRKGCKEPISYFPKGPKGAKACLATLSRKGVVGMLLDQKMNDGVASVFLGHPAMTASALAQFALRYQAAILPVHIVRLKGARFKCIFSAPVNYTKEETIESLTDKLNDLMGEWIKATPQQWFWVHSRWPFSKAKKPPNNGRGE